LYMTMFPTSHVDQNCSVGTGFMRLHSYVARRRYSRSEYLTPRTRAPTISDPSVRTPRIGLAMHTTRRPTRHSWPRYARKSAAWFGDLSRRSGATLHGRHAQQPAMHPALD
jgi:hypothetical protein